MLYTRIIISPALYCVLLGILLQSNSERCVSTILSRGGGASSCAGNGIIKTSSIDEAMKAVDRGLFVPDASTRYKDAPQVLGCGATISAPHMHAYCLEILGEQLKPGARCLDIGSGSGYLCAVMAHLVNPPGAASGAAASGGSSSAVIGVEHIPQLVEASIQALKQIHWVDSMMRNGRLQILGGDGRLG